MTIPLANNKKDRQSHRVSSLCSQNLCHCVTGNILHDAGSYLYFISPEATDNEMIPPEANVKVADVTNCSLSRVHYLSTPSNHRYLHLEAAVRPITVIKWLSQAQGQAALGQSWTLSSQDILLADESQRNSHTMTHPVALLLWLHT